MKYVFLINSFTVSKDINVLVNKIKKYCVNNNLEYIIEINGENISTEDILKKYSESKNIIIPIGGDGIINRTLNAIIGTKNILGFIPLGTGNDLYRTVKTQFKDGINLCDVIKVNDKYFINTMCFGIDADIANNKELFKYKFIPKNYRYTLSILYTFLKYKNKYLKVKDNKKIIKDNFTTITICNGCFYGGGYYVSPNSILNDGKMQVFLIPKTNKLSLIKLILSIKKGKHLNSKKVSFFSTSKIEISSTKACTTNIDGERMTSKKYNLEVIKSGIKVYYDSKLIEYILDKKS